MNVATGAISGIPSVSGSFAIRLTATNSSGTGSATLNLTVKVPAPSISSATATTATLNSHFSYAISATNSPTKFAANGLPNGLSVNTNSGVISGTPTYCCRWSATISATNSTGTGSAGLQITVNSLKTATVSKTTSTTSGHSLVQVQIATTGTADPSLSSGSSEPVTDTVVSDSTSSTTRLTNLSVRANAGSGSDLLMVGFVVSGGTKSMLVRAIGPTLTQFGVTGALADPQLSLFSGTTLDQSDLAWGGGTALVNAFNNVGAFPLASTSNDSALVASLPAGSYTAQVVSASGASGVALAEIYDADSSATPDGRLINLSARATVGSGNGVLVAGFIVSGTAPETVLIRGIGPALTQFGVTGALANPQLTLYDSSGNVLNSNTGWGGTTDLTNAFAEAGAFNLADDSNDTAILVTLAPGAYSAQVNGVNGSTGTAMIEVYEMH